jgi:hypothetical protein
MNNTIIIAITAFAWLLAAGFSVLYLQLTSWRPPISLMTVPRPGWVRARMDRIRARFGSRERFRLRTAELSLRRFIVGQSVAIGVAAPRSFAVGRVAAIGDETLVLRSNRYIAPYTEVEISRADLRLSGWIVECRFIDSDWWLKANFNRDAREEALRSVERRVA